MIKHDWMYRKDAPEVLQRALVATGGNVQRAAARLGVQRHVIYSMLKKYGLWGVLDSFRAAVANIRAYEPPKDPKRK